MGTFKIGGRTAGAQDGFNLNLPACYRAKGTRARLGCDAAVPDSDMLDKIDSGYATKVIAALSVKLDANEMGRILMIMRDAGLIDKEEERAVNEAMAPEATSPEAAMDGFASRFPDASRIVTLSGGMVDEQRYRARQTAMAPVLPKPTAAAVRRSQAVSDAEAGFAARYPDAMRIGKV